MKHILVLSSGARRQCTTVRQTSRTSKELQCRGVLVGSGGRVASVLTSSTAGRRGLGARAAVAAAAAERFASGRSALAAPRGHGPVRALLSLSLSRDPHRGLGFTGSPGFVHVSSRGPGP